MPPLLPTTDVITVTPPTGPVQRYRAASDLRREVIAAGGWLWQPAYLAALPRWIDDITRDFGDVYTQMLWDPAAQSATRLLRESAVSAAVAVPATVDGTEVSDGHPEYGAAQKIADFCTHNLTHVQPGMRAFLFELSEAIITGHALAEQKYDTVTLDPALGPQLVLTALKVRPPTRYAFVVDPYGNQPGVHYAAPGQPLAVGNTVQVGADGTLVNFLPRRQYVLFTHWPQYHDPRGRSILRAAYHSWWFKKQTWLEYLRYMATFASPMLWATTAPEARPNPDTGATPEADTLVALETLRNGGVAVGAAGATLQPIQVQGEGRAFLSAIDLSNHEITLSVLMATRATMEAEHGSRADSGTAQDVVELGVARLRADLAAVVAADILTPLIVYNFGTDALRYLPAVSLAAAERHDLPAERTAVGALMGANPDFIHSSMYPPLREDLGLPPADPALEAADRKAKADLTAQLAQIKAATPPNLPPGTDTNAPSADTQPAQKEAPPHA